MNTNDTKYDDTTLQAAIDNAMVNANLTNFTTLVVTTLWIDQRPHRLALARALLSRLPEPTPPTADGKTPGQVSAEAQAKLDYVHNMGLRFGMMNSSDKPEPYLSHFWTDDSDHERMFREWSASIGGQTSLEAGIKRMEAELARIIAAAHEAGWNGVENSKDLAQFIKDQAETLEKWSEHIHPDDHDRIVKGVQDRAKAAIAEARQEALPQLRPIATCALGVCLITGLYAIGALIYQNL